MKILIAGAGTVGQTLAGKLVKEGHDVIVMDSNSHNLRQLEEYYDLQTVNENALNVKTLKHVGVENADLVIAVTNSDADNVMVCHLAHKMGAKRKIARIRSDGIFKEPGVLTGNNLGIDDVIFPEKMASQDILRLLLKPYAVQGFEFLNTKIEVLEMVVQDGDLLVGKTLVDLPTLNKKVFRIACIKRGDGAFIPGADDVIAEGDHIFVAALAVELEDVIQELGFEVKPIEKVFIFGGTNIGMDLALSLEESQIKVSIVDPSRSKTKEMAFQLNNALVLHGDGTDANLLEGEGVSEAEVFVAVTDDENANLLSCLLAKKLGVKKTISLVTKPDFVPLISQLNIDSIISQRLISINKIMHYVRRGNIVAVEELVENKIHALEFRVTDKTLVIEEAISSETFRNEFPRGCLIGGVIRESVAFVVEGNSTFELDDRVVVFCPEEKVPEIEAFFA